MAKTKTVKQPPVLVITKTGESDYAVTSGENDYRVAKNGDRWSCTCKAFGMCKHLRTVVMDSVMRVGTSVSVPAATDAAHDDLIFSVHKFEFQVAKRVDPQEHYINSMSEAERQAAVGHISGAKEYGLLKSYQRLPEEAKAVISEMARRANEGRKG